MSYVKRILAYLPNSAQQLWMFYCSLSSGNKSAVWLANGLIFGSIWGTQDRLKKEEEQKADYLEIAEYKVQKSRIKDFEKMWNDSAKRSQSQRGYGWTRTYKAIAWEDSPFQYLSTRQWDAEPVEDVIFNTKFAEAGLGEVQKRQFITVVDDSVVRTIT